MGIRDTATSWWLDLQRIKVALGNMGDCEDRDEMCAISYELAADIDSIMYDIDVELELNMEGEE